jgi:hypothetical protein
MAGAAFSESRLKARERWIEMSRKRFGPWKQIDNVRVRDNQLVFQNPSNTGKSTMPFALGLVVHGRSGNFQGRSNGDDQQIRIQLAESAERILLSPPFTETGNASLMEDRELAELVFWAVDNHTDRQRCLHLLERVHYLPRPRRGIFLACRFKSNDQQHSAFHGAPRGTRQREWAKPGAIIACAVIDSLMHGQPLGRVEIAKRLGFSTGPMEWSRTETISNLRVAWLSRIAVALPFQQLGIGTQLALKARRMTRQMRIPKTDFLEVIRSFPANHTKQKDCDGDFLERAGFLKVQWPMRSKQCQFPLPNSRRTVLQKAVKFYYYADLRNDD